MNFKVLQDGGLLSDALWLDETQLPAYAYSSALEESGVVLVFDQASSGVGTSTPAETLQVLDIQPNPFVDKTTIGFSLPPGGGGTAQLRVYDAAGRNLWNIAKEFPEGYNTEQIDLGGISSAGVLFCELTTPYGSWTKQVVRVAR